MKITSKEKPLTSSDFIDSYDIVVNKTYERRVEQWNEVKGIAKRNGVSYDNWIQRMTKLGHNYKKAASIPNNSHVSYIEVDGVRVKRQDFLDKHGVPLSTWRRWVEQMTFQEALEKAKKKLEEKTKNVQNTN